MLNELIKTTHTEHLQGVVFEGEAVPPPTQIPWYAISDFAASFSSLTIRQVPGRYGMGAQGRQKGTAKAA
jgi:hypothetical protein